MMTDLMTRLGRLFDSSEVATVNFTVVASKFNTGLLQKWGYDIESDGKERLSYMDGCHVIRLCLKVLDTDIPGHATVLDRLDEVKNPTGVIAPFKNDSYYGSLKNMEQEIYDYFEI